MPRITAGIDPKTAMAVTKGFAAQGLTWMFPIEYGGVTTSPRDVP